MSFRMMPLAAAAALAVVAGVAAAPTLASAAPAAPAAVTADATSGTYAALAPSRLLDTRTGLGVPKLRLGPKATLTFQVTGRGGVPAAGVTAAVINLTAVNPTASTFLVAYPEGSTRPGVSTLNLPPRTVRANLATVPVSAAGKIAIYNSVGTTDVLADVVGYYNADASGRPVAAEYFQAASRDRFVDTRNDPQGPLAPGEVLTGVVEIADATNVKALALNVTVVAPTSSGFFTVWSGTGAAPTTSSVNFAARQTVPNLVVTQTAQGGNGTVRYSVRNGSSGTAHLLVDFVGAYLQGGPNPGLHYRRLAPTRVVDTRLNRGITGAIPAKTTRSATVPGTLVNPDTVYAVVANVTAIQPTAGTFLTLWGKYTLPEARPGVSDVNAAANEVAANAAMVPIGETGAFNVYNSAGSTNVAVDVTGALELPVAPSVSAGARQPSASAPATIPRTDASGSSSRR